MLANASSSTNLRYINKLPGESISENASHDKLLRYWSNVANQKAYLERLATHLSISSLDGWYLVPNSVIIAKGGEFLLKLHNNSLYYALSEVYPFHDWQPWKFAAVPTGYWADEEAQYRFFEWLAEQLHVDCLEAWYSVAFRDVSSLGGGTIINYYHQGSLQRALLFLYPEVTWHGWRFDNNSRNYWNDRKLRDYFDWVAKKLDIKGYEGWYGITVNDLAAIGGKSVLQHYGGSLRYSLEAAYPEYHWIPWLFAQVSMRYWLNEDHQCQYFEWLAEDLQIKTPDDWYNVTQVNVCLRDGAGLLRMYFEGSLAKAFRTLYPEYKWQLWRIGMFDWENLANQRLYFDWIASQLRLARMEDWYNVTKAKVDNFPDSQLLTYYYGDSLSRALSTVYSEFNWQPWRFARTPPKFWKEQENVQKYLRWLTGELGLVSQLDWHQVASREVCKLKGGYLVRTHGGLQQMLSRYGIFVSPSLFKKPKHQVLLLKMVREIFPTVEILFEYTHPQLLYKETKKSVQLDIFIPELSLAFEYQGEQHYSWYLGPPDSIQKRDREKANLCEAAGIKLVVIPYWWDRTEESFRATLQNLLPHY